MWGPLRMAEAERKLKLLYLNGPERSFSLS